MFRSKSRSTISRLLQRECFGHPPGASGLGIRKFYDNVYPTRAVHGATAPTVRITKFTHDGRYLLCISEDGQHLVVYVFKGLSCVPAANAELDPSFETFFWEQGRVRLCSGTEELVGTFCLLDHRGELVILASQDRSRAQQGDSEGGSLMRQVSFHMVALDAVEVTDTFVLNNDFVNLSFNSGAVHLYCDLLTVLSLHHQTIHLLQITPEGRFVQIVALGRFCFEDDAMVVHQQEQREEQFHQQQRSCGEKHSYSATAAHAGAQLQPTDRAAAPAGAPADAAPVRGPNAAARVGDRDGSLIEGVRHRILVYLWRKMGLDARTRSRGFFRVYEHFRELMIHKVKMLDHNHLLLCLAPGLAALGSAQTVCVVYCIHEARCLLLHSLSEPQLVQLYLRCPREFAGAGGASLWTRCAGPTLCPCNREPSRLSGAHHEQEWSEMLAKWVMNMLPAGCQLSSLSPYLDPCLFAFEETQISAIIAPRPVPRAPLDFYLQPRLHSVAAAGPSRPVFQLPSPPSSAEATGLGHTSSPEDRILHFFHPSAPFVMALVSNSRQPCTLSFYFWDPP